MKLTSLNPRIKKILASGFMALTVTSFAGCSNQKSEASSNETVSFVEKYDEYQNSDLIDNIRLTEDYYQDLIALSDYNFTAGDMPADLRFYLDQQELKKYLYDEEPTPENCYYVQRNLSNMAGFVMYPKSSAIYSGNFGKLSFEQQLALVEMLGQAMNMFENSAYKDQVNYLYFITGTAGITGASVESVDEKLELRFGDAYSDAKTNEVSNYSYKLQY